jgi:hypothetical protein
MRQFDHPNMENFKCPICKTATDAPVVLIPIKTEKDGFVECRQIHSECFKVVMKMNGVDVEIEP